MTLKTPYKVIRYRERVIEKVKPYFHGETLLDSGCGDGEDSSLLKAYFKSITATDIEENPRWKEFASENLVFKKENSESLSFESSSFDTVTEKDMLHHAENPEKALSEMVRVSKKRIIVIEANRYNPLFYINLTLLNNHQHFTKKRFRGIIESAGVDFEIKKFSARVFPLNIKWMIKAFEKLEDFTEIFPPYSPIIEYNLAVLTKK